MGCVFRKEKKIHPTNSLENLRINLEPIYTSEPKPQLRFNCGIDEVIFENSLGIAMPRSLSTLIEQSSLGYSGSPQIRIDAPQRLSHPLFHLSKPPADPTLLSVAEK